MFKYLQNVINKFPEVITDRAASLAHDRLSEIRDKKKAKKLSKEQALAFYHSMAQLLVIAMRVRRDIQTAVVFFTTRVKSLDEDDWGKLKRVLQYWNSTKNLKLRLTVESLGMLKWYVGGFHNMHWN